MPSTTTRQLAIGATLFGGLLAGMAANKVFVQMPAWSNTGVVAWAEFTRTSDAGLGLILFPAIGGAALICTVGTAIGFRVARICSTSSRDTSILLINIVLFVWERPRLSTVIVCSRTVIVWIILQLSQH